MTEQQEPDKSELLTITVGPTLLGLLAEKGYSLRVRVDGLDILEPE